MLRSETAAADLKEIQRQIRNLQQQQRRRGHFSKKIFLQRHPSSTCTLLVFHFSGHDTRVALDFMRGRGRAKGKVSNPSSEERKTLCVAVQEHFAARVEHGGCDPTAWVGVTQRELILSARFVLERCLYDWVWQQNCVKGVAPSRNQLMEEGAKLLPATVPEPAKTSLQTVFQSAARTQRKWLASFRFRWDARIGALRIQEHVPRHVMQSKAHEWRSFKFTRFILFRILSIVIFLLIIFFWSTF